MYPAPPKGLLCAVDIPHRGASKSDKEDIDPLAAPPRILILYLRRSATPCLKVSLIYLFSLNF